MAKKFYRTTNIRIDKHIVLSFKDQSHPIPRTEGSSQLLLTRGKRPRDSPEEGHHEGAGGGPEEEVRRREHADGGVVDGGVEGGVHHGHQAVQGAQDGGHFA